MQNLTENYIQVQYMRTNADGKNERKCVALRNEPVAS